MHTICPLAGQPVWALALHKSKALCGVAEYFPALQSLVS